MDIFRCDNIRSINQFKHLFEKAEDIPIANISCPVLPHSFPVATINEETALSDN